MMHCAMILPRFTANILCRIAQLTVIVSRCVSHHLSAFRRPLSTTTERERNVVLLTYFHMKYFKEIFGIHFLLTTTNVLSEDHITSDFL